MYPLTLKCASRMRSIIFPSIMSSDIQISSDRGHVFFIEFIVFVPPLTIGYGLGLVFLYKVS